MVYGIIRPLTQESGSKKNKLDDFPEDLKEKLNSFIK